VDDRRGLRGASRPRERIGLFQDRAVARADSRLVFSSSAKSGMKISQTRWWEAHRRDAAVPGVEVADHADAIRVRRPHREMHPRGAALHDTVRAQLLERGSASLAQQMQIVVGQHPAIAVRIVDLDRLSPG